MAVLNTKRGEGDNGFTLVELTVVVVIIGIVLALATMTFIGARQRADDRAAQARAKTALKTQEVYYAGAMSYTSEPSALHRLESSLTFSTFTTEASVLGAVYLREASGNSATLVARSATGTCFWVKTENGHAVYGKGSCSSEPAWGDSW